MVQPVPKQLTREEKEELVEMFVENIESHPVIGLLDMNNLPSRQLQEIKKEMKDFAKVRMSRKTLINLAIEDADKDDIEELDTNEAVQPALIFSEKDPFQLFSLIQKNKTSAAAQGGEIAPTDIEIPEGDTGIGPGPMLGKLQGAGAQVQVDDGSIHVQKSAVLVEAGEEISSDDAEILNQLGIEPLEIGLDLKIAYSDGEIFTREELDIDTEEYRSDVEAAAAGAFNLAVNAGVINSTTAPAIISKAVQEAKNLAISEGLPVEETIEEAVAYAAANARGVDSELDIESALEDLNSDEEEEESEEPESETEEAEDSVDEGSDDDESAEEDEGSESDDESGEEEE
ncbi:MAG: 50S ribosomal protein L10 [Candidatus Nanohaloarchaea archaeon]